MNEQNKADEKDVGLESDGINEIQEEQTAGEAGQDAEGAGPDAEKVVDLSDLLFNLKTEYEKEKAVAAEYLRRLQSLQADYDNFRKRTQREKEELAKYAAEKLIKELLPVLDNMERGLAASRQSQDFEGLAKGVEMTFRQLTSLLEKEGLTPIESVGTEFDPTKHEAVMHVEAEGFAPNSVVDELQKGYYLKEKVLRPSMVRVSM
ncbi:MAG TPA: nucleotide exchange factor GrpE [Verrucomicrobiae bacterium]|nr:nucleotide exchange factor GrpE [Verrucomicrobiae bacterium]